MPVTRIADIIVPEIFAPYVIEQTAAKSALWASQLIDLNAEYDRLAGGGGSTVNMPFYRDLSGTSEVLSETTALTTNKITAVTDQAVINYRGKLWAANDLASAKSGDDPMMAIGSLVATWWARDFQTTVIEMLKGVFASTTMASEHVTNLAIEDGTAATSSNLISSSATIDALKKMGDAIQAIEAIAMHGDIYWELVKDDVIDFVKPSEVEVELPRYKGMAVIVDDSLPKVAGSTSGFKYSTYLFGAGAIAFGEATLDPNEAAETDRDITVGDDFLVNRRHFILHPKGVKWTPGGGVPAGVSPTNAEFATGSNWTRVYEKKNVPLLALVTNG